MACTACREAIRRVKVSASFFDTRAIVAAVRAHVPAEDGEGRAVEKRNVNDDIGVDGFVPVVAERNLVVAEKRVLGDATVGTGAQVLLETGQEHFGGLHAAADQGAALEHEHATPALGQIGRANQAVVPGAGEHVVESIAGADSAPGRRRARLGRLSIRQLADDERRQRRRRPHEVASSDSHAVQPISDPSSSVNPGAAWSIRVVCSGARPQNMPGDSLPLRAVPDLAADVSSGPATRKLAGSSARELECRESTSAARPGRRGTDCRGDRTLSSHAHSIDGGGAGGGSRRLDSVLEFWPAARSRGCRDCRWDGRR